MTSARLNTEALESCFRRVIWRGVKEKRPPASTAQGGFLLCQKSRNLVYYTWQPSIEIEGNVANPGEGGKQPAVGVPTAFRPKTSPRPRVFRVLTPIVVGEAGRLAFVQAPRLSYSL